MTPRPDLPPSTYELIGRIAMVSSDLEMMVASISNVYWKGKPKALGNRKLDSRQSIFKAMQDSMNALTRLVNLPNLAKWKRFTRKAKAALQRRDLIVHSYVVYEENIFQLYHARTNSFINPSDPDLSDIYNQLTSLVQEAWFMVATLSRNMGDLEELIREQTN